MKRIKENDPTLTAVNISRSRLDAKQLADALVSNITLTDLCLSDVMLMNDGTRLIAESLMHNKSITTLDLSDNYIGSDGATFIADLLEVNTTLTTLNITHNNIGGDGLSWIGYALKVNKTLSNLYLGRGVYNDIIEDAFRNYNGSIVFVYPEMISPVIRACTVRNRYVHTITRKAVICLLLIGRFRRLAGIPYDIWKIIGRFLWASRVERVWWHPVKINEK